MLDSSAAATGGETATHGGRGGKAKGKRKNDEDENGMSSDDGGDDDDAPAGGAQAARRTARQSRSESVPIILSRLVVACPGALPALANSLQTRLKSTDLAQRLSCTRALAVVFGCGSGDTQLCNPADHKHTFTLFHGRFCDLNGTIRAAMAQWAGEFIIHYVPPRGGGGADLLPTVVDGLTQRLQDPDEVVRQASVTAACAVASSAYTRCPPETLRAVCQCLADIKPAVQQAAITGLCAVYAAYVARVGASIAGGAQVLGGPDTEVYDCLPVLLISVAAKRDAATGGQLALDALLDGRLFSTSCSPATVAACLLRAHASSDSDAKAATLIKFISLHQKSRISGARWLAARRAGRSAQEQGGGAAGATPPQQGESDGTLPDQAVQAALRELAFGWPKADAVVADLMKLHATRDGHMFRALEGLLAGDCITFGVSSAQCTSGAGVNSATALRADALRRMRAAMAGTTHHKGSTQHLATVLDQLCVKLMPQPVDARVVDHLLDRMCVLMRVGEHDQNLDDETPPEAMSPEAASALAILSAAAESVPACFGHASAALLALMRARCPEVVTAALRIVYIAAPGMLASSDAPQMARSWRAPLTALCTAGTRQQAKQAARCLAALVPGAVASVARGLLSRLPSLTDESLPSALASVAMLLATASVAAAGSPVESEEDASLTTLMAFVCNNLAHRPHMPPVRGAGNPHPVAVLAACGVKAVAFAAIPLAQHGTNKARMDAVKHVVDTLLVPLLSRDPDGAFNPNGSEASVDAVRQAAAKGLVKLALRARPDALDPPAFGALCIAVQNAAETPALRQAIRRPLLKHAALRNCMHPRSMALLALTAGGAGAADRIPPTLLARSEDAGAVAAAAAVASAVRSCVWALRSRLHKELQNRAPGAHGDEAPSLLATGPEMALFYCLWGLAQCPHVPQSAEQWASEDASPWLPHVQRPLEALLDALLSGPAGGYATQLGVAGSHKHKAGAALPQLFRMLDQIKLSAPRGLDAADALHAAAEVAEKLLNCRATANQWAASPAGFPMQTPMPKMYFQTVAPAALQVLSPNQGVGARGGGRRLLSSTFKLLLDAPTDRGNGAARKKKRPAAVRNDYAGGDSDVDDDVPAAPAPAGRTPRANANEGPKARAKDKAAAPPKKKARGDAEVHAAAGPSRRQPKRGAAMRVDLYEDDDEEEEKEVNEENAMQGVTAAPPPLRKPFTLIVDTDSDAEEDIAEDRRLGLHPYRKAAAPEQAPMPQPMEPQPVEEEDGAAEEEETGIRTTGRSARRRR